MYSARLFLARYHCMAVKAAGEMTVSLGSRNDGHWVASQQCRNYLSFRQQLSTPTSNCCLSCS